MPNFRFHKRIDKEVLEKGKFIPKNYDSKTLNGLDVHEAMDYGSNQMGTLHRAIDKWHDPEWVARIALTPNNKGRISKKYEKQFRYNYRIAKAHLLVDTYCSYYKERYKKYPSFKTVKKYIMKTIRKHRKRDFTPNKKEF